MNELNLDKLFNPDSIAMIGASGSPGKWGFIIMINILKGNYRGTFYPVNPGRESILGYKCYASVKDISEPLDVAIITTPAKLVPPLIDECGEKGIPYVIVITSDFSETGSEGKRLEREVVARARSYGMRIVGPNTMGIFSSKSNLHALMPPVMPLQGPVSMFSQSGNVGVQMLAWGVDEGVGFEKFISSGNEGDLNCEDYLRYFNGDDATKVVLAYIEGIDPGVDLLSAAKEVSTRKPIIVYKGGRTDTGGKAAASHSGAMAGSSKIFSAAFRQAGMIEVTTGHELMDCAKALSTYPLPRGNRVGILTRGGGWGVMTADACEEYGLVIPPLPDKLIDKFDMLLPKYWSRGNPVDMVAVIDRDPYRECLDILADWDEVDAIIALGAGGRGHHFNYSKELKGTKELMEALAMSSHYIELRIKAQNETIKYIGELVKRSGKPIIAVSIGSNGTHRSNLSEYQVVSYPTPERAVRALKRMYDYRCFLNSQR
jgi:acyl-CoA synthetase (NDP forming)